MSDLDGNSLIAHVTREYIFTSQKRSYQIGLLFYGAILLLIWIGCAKKPITPTGVVPSPIPTIRVCLEEQLASGSLNFLTPYQLNLEEAVYVLDSTVGTFQVSWENRHLTFRSRSRFFSFEKFERIEFIPLEKGEFSWRGNLYNGKIIFAKNGNSIIIVNELLLPDYLRGVVPYEIPSHSEEYYQAIVSQTIAAATYAYYALKNPASPFFDIYSDNRDQIYQGNRIKTALVDKAVLESQGLVLLTVNDQVVKLQYHSTCGGAIDHFPLTSTSGNQSNFIHDSWNDQVNCEISPQFRWVRSFTAQDLLDNLTKMGLLNAAQTTQWKNQGYSLEIEIVSRNNSGRVEKMKLKVHDQEILLSNWQIRQVLADRSNNLLPSNLFIIKRSQKKPDQFYIVGAGFGHGRGMCQWGAIGLALRGNSYKDILHFYYPDLKLSKVF